MSQSKSKTMTVQSLPVLTVTTSEKPRRSSSNGNGDPLGQRTVTNPFADGVFFYAQVLVMV